MSEQHGRRVIESTPLDMQIGIIRIPLPIVSGRRTVDSYYLVARLDALEKTGYALLEGYEKMNEEELNRYYYSVVCSDILAKARENGLVVKFDEPVGVEQAEITDGKAGHKPSKKNGGGIRNTDAWNERCFDNWADR